MSIAVIGTAGRELNERKRMNATLFDEMCRHVSSMIMKDSRSIVALASGGAAGADHVAVHLFLKSKEMKEDKATLTLFLPAPWDRKNAKFHDNGLQWKHNPGGLANFLHYEFSRTTERQSLNEIQRAIELGAIVNVYSGFHARNTALAKHANQIIALTWNNASFPARSSGTGDTWAKAKAQGKKTVHVPLQTFTSDTKSTGKKRARQEKDQ